MWLSEMKFVIIMIQANTVLKIYEVLAARKKKHSARMLAKTNVKRSKVASYVTVSKAADSCK